MNINADFQQPVDDVRPRPSGGPHAPLSHGMLTCLFNVSQLLPRINTFEYKRPTWATLSQNVHLPLRMIAVSYNHCSQLDSMVLLANMI